GHHLIAASCSDRRRRRRARGAEQLSQALGRFPTRVMARIRSCSSPACRSAILLVAMVLPVTSAAALVALDHAAPGAATELRQPSPYLPHSHWAVTALRRLTDAGEGLPGYDVGRRTPRLVEVTAAFQRAADGAEDPALREIAAGWLRLLRDEFGATPV